MSTTTQTETTSQKVAIVLGATGETGSQALLSALASPSISRVISLGRRAPTLPPSVQESKFQHVNVDFEKLLAQDAAEQNKLKDAGRAADVVICALGTTRAAAGGMEGFVKIDREYVLEACKQARVDGKDQRLAYCSATGASSSALFPYSKSKGLTEEGLAALGYSETIMFRPGMLVVPGGRKEHRLLESIAAKVTGVLALVTSSIEIKTPVLAHAMVRSNLLGRAELEKAKLGHEELLKGHSVWVMGNADALQWGSEAK